MNEPHGGKLVNKILSTEEADIILSNASAYKKIALNDEQIKDIKNIARGVYSPIEGFLKKDDFESVVANMRLKNGVVFSIPLVLDISKEKADEIKSEQAVLLTDLHNHPIGILKDFETYAYDKKFFAENVFGTLDKTHPGVESVFHMHDYLIGGEINLLYDTKIFFPEHNYTPKETRRIFQGRGWNKIVAFQTRNVPHRAHEFLQIEALKEVDGLFVQPVVGEKKLDDFKDEYIISSYEVLIDKYYPKNKAVLGVLPLKMRYAGPREAVFHAIIRKNYGCTHFIVGRDHAGVGSYYSPFAAQEIFDNFAPGELDIEIVKFPEIVVRKSTQDYAYASDVPEDDVLKFSGTQLRNYIKNKEQPPEYIIRKEVYDILTEKKNVLVDDLYQKHQHKKYTNQKGFVLWFTGLSQSGKSTIAERLYEILEDKGVNTEILDGDIVREALTKDLGFSKEDRDENIRRVGFVAKLLSRNNVAVMCSFISPYKAQRDGVRIKTENFIEVFVNTPLEVCERRDRKGLYAKARSGEIKQFTGISDPYEEPENPEIELKPAEEGVDDCVDRVIKYLEDNRYL